MADKKKPRVGVYICHCGGNISDVVDTGKVAEEIAKLDEVAVSKDFIFMCSDPGQNMIAEDVKKNNLDHVIVASCSPRLHEMTFQKVVSDAGLNPFQYKHVNIREQVSWVHSHHPEDATEKAYHLIRGGIAAVLKQDPLNPIEKSMIQKAAVIGGGISGMTAALDLADRDIPVHIIEKAPVLGGHLLDIDKVFPVEQDAQEMIKSMIQRTMSHPNIFLHLNTEVVKSDGAVGSFRLVLKKTDQKVTSEDDFVTTLAVTNNKVEEDVKELRVGSIIVTTGHDYCEPDEGEFGYKKSPYVITLPELILQLNNYHGDKFVYRGKEIKNVAMVHCVGSRQIEGVHIPKNGKYNTGCSRVCCTTTLQQANRLKEMFPKINIYDLYRDIRTYGEQESYYKEASENNVIFVKYPDDEPPEIVPGQNITIKTKDILTYGLELEMEVDMVVLAVGMVPRIKPSIIEDLSLPIGQNGFLQEAHVKLRPVESSSEGVFIAGTAQGPKNIRESTMTASAAAAKASTLLTKEIIELSPFVAVVDADACDGCTKCVDECEYNAITIADTGLSGDSTKLAVVESSLCTGCGACVPACPTEAIMVQGYDLKKIKAQIEAMLVEAN